MKSYTLQVLREPLPALNRDEWQTIQAETPEDAIVEAIRPLLAKGINPEIAYVALGNARHPNGAPMCVQSYSLKVNREGSADK